MNDFKNEKSENLQKIKALSEEAREHIQPITKAMQRVEEVFQPLIEAAEAWSKMIKRMSLSFEIPAPLKVIGKMKDSQYVFWDYFTQPFIKEILGKCDINVVLYDYESEDNFVRSENIIEKCKQHLYLESHLLLFSQTVNAYHEGKYNLAVIGLTAVIDAVLSKASGNHTHKPKDRCNAILEKLMAEEYVADDEYATLTLFMTFNAMVKSFYESIPFSDNEPNHLNRNWIMHGRSLSENTRLDCIKLLRFLYGIILINYIDEQGIVSKD